MFWGEGLMLFFIFANNIRENGRLIYTFKAQRAKCLMLFKQRKKMSGNVLCFVFTFYGFRDTIRAWRDAVWLKGSLWS